MVRTILVTGASGFLGSHLIEALVERHFNVVAVKRKTSNTKRITHLLDKIRIYDTDDLSLIFINEKIDVIINTVCCYGRNNERLIEMINSNLIFGLNLLDEAVKYNVKTFINTDSLLPRNINDYSLSKAQLTDWLYKKSNNIQVVNLKIEHMYGPNDDKNKFIPWLINKMINESDDILLTSGIQRRDFIYINDIVDVFVLILKKKEVLSNWNQFEVGTNNFIKVKSLVLTIAKELEKILKKKIIERLKFGNVSYRKGEIMVPELDNSRLLELGWKPKVTLSQGIQNIIKDTI